MTDIINLRQHRKSKARAADEKKAAENRRVFGRTKGEKKRAAVEEEKAKARLEGHKREREEEDEAPGK